MKKKHNLSEQEQQREINKIKTKQVMTQDVLELAQLIINARNEDIKKCNIKIKKTPIDDGKEVIEGSIKFKIEKINNDIILNIPHFL